MSGPTVAPTTPEDIDHATAVLTLAFASDALVRWLFPEPHEYLARFPAIARVHAARVIPAGGGFHTSDFRGASLWYPPSASMDGAALFAILEESIPPERLKSVELLFGQMATYRPAGEHWYLRQIGVDPSMQGKGYGSVLLREALAACDRAKLPAYLEATSPANRSLYERVGFVTTGEVSAPGAPALWPMVRAARG